MEVMAAAGPSVGSASQAMKAKTAWAGASEAQTQLDDRGGSLLAAGPSGAKISNRPPELSAFLISLRAPSLNTEPARFPNRFLPGTRRSGWRWIAGDSRRDSDTKMPT
jgi:hypothetical protein